MWECTFRGLDHSGSQPFNWAPVNMANEGSQEVQEDSPDVCVIHYFSESIATVLQILSLGHNQLCTAMETLCCKLQCIRRSYNGSEF